MSSPRLISDIHCISQLDKSAQKREEAIQAREIALRKNNDILEAQQASFEARLREDRVNSEVRSGVCVFNLLIQTLLS
jgi:hypothetical protein